jgi:hypothetical protein
VSDRFTIFGGFGEPTVAVPPPPLPPCGRRRRSTLRALMVLCVAVLFIAGPTPGDIGGCGGSEASTPIQGSAAQSEYDYFDQGLCAHICLRLRECGVLCRALQDPGPNCDPNSPNAYIQCIRGALRADIFHTGSCPHTCSSYAHGRFSGAVLEDVAVCGHAVDAIACNDLPAAIVTAPAQCTGICQN